MLASKFFLINFFYLVTDFFLLFEIIYYILNSGVIYHNAAVTILKSNEPDVYYSDVAMVKW